MKKLAIFLILIVVLLSACSTAPAAEPVIEVAEPVVEEVEPVSEVVEQETTVDEHKTQEAISSEPVLEIIGLDESFSTSMPEVQNLSTADHEHGRSPEFVHCRRLGGNSQQRRGNHTSAAAQGSKYH